MNLRNWMAGTLLMVSATIILLLKYTSFRRWDLKEKVFLFCFVGPAYLMFAGALVNLNENEFWVWFKQFIETIQ